ncbi:type IV toxin-antitoxin system AbiEi family antitoxin domain-containing protein [Nocardioides sp. 1609]|uniref:type IV toxin-antitoxin system AbiEi family antitoxin domain-containing protein n=1 Tax=Nocardioides sp. 1609 TaxID=2508327 RepID=UPI00106FD968|nr:type IV toxin-antitoxin system AbiEi family antitoxin domain-containing protein [Nocardioides sp. 1609]
MTRARTTAQVQALLAVLPQDGPFTAAEALALGLSNPQCRELVARRLLVRRVPGVYHVAALRDSLELRLAALRLVVPPDCVVTDRTAAWVWLGARALAPGEHVDLPRISVFGPPGRRLRNGLVDSGERRLAARDVREVEGVLVTTPLRTACDLGRLLHPDQALAAMDALATLCAVEEISTELPRFKGYRGIVQARALLPIVDPRSGSQFESIARLRWHQAGLPHPECQVPVPAPDGGWFYVDIGLPETRFGLEFFGEEFHGPEQHDHDETRLAWAREQQGWTLVVARGPNVVGRHQDVERTLRRAWEDFRRG